MVILRLPGRWRMARFRIRGYGGSDCTTKGTTQDGALAATDFVAYGCASSSAKSSAYRGIHGRISRIRCSSKQGGRQEKVSRDHGQKESLLIKSGMGIIVIVSHELSDDLHTLPGFRCRCRVQQSVQSETCKRLANRVNRIERTHAPRYARQDVRNRQSPDNRRLTSSPASRFMGRKFQTCSPATGRFPPECDHPGCGSCALCLPHHRGGS